MMPPASLAGLAPGSNGAPPSDLFAHLLSVNPFTDNRVNGPAPEVADVGDIHRAAFERLVAVAEEAGRLRRGIGAVLWGEPGIGKSHLLARLGAGPRREGRSRLSTSIISSPAPRGFRVRCCAVVSNLTAGRSNRFCGTPLFRLVASFAHEAFAYDPAARPDWPAVERAYGRLVQRQQPGRIERNAYDVLFRFFYSAYRTNEGSDDGLAPLAVRWLAGDYLDPSEAGLLHLPPGPARDEPVGLADNQQVKQVLVVLARLAQSARQPLLLGFDQVDNLDDGQMAALARFLEALLDTAPNLLVVTAGVQATLLHWRQKGLIQESAWHRLAQFEVPLQRVSPADAERIVAARLAQFLAPFRNQLGWPPDPVFPLGRAWLAEVLHNRIDLRPREVINWAREGYARQQEALRQAGGSDWLANWSQLPSSSETTIAADPGAIQGAIDRCVLIRLGEQRSQRLAHPRALPPDADNLSGLVAALLERCRVAVERSGSRSAYQLVLRRRAADGGEKTRLVFLVTASAHSTAAALRQLTQAPQRDGRTFLVTDQRRPLKLGQRGQEYLEMLREGAAGQFQHVELSFADYANLDALQAVVGLACSGDLELEQPGAVVHRVTEAEAVASLTRQGCYQSAPLLRELLTEPLPVGTA